MDIKYEWTDGRNPVFEEFYKITEDYYSKIVGGLQNRRSFVPYNVITDIKDVLIAYDKDKTPVACASFKKYSETDAEIKRVWVEPEYRGNHIAYEMMLKIQERAKAAGFKRTILQTREIMEDAIGLYERLGYFRIDNYSPYDKMSGAVCFAKNLESDSGTSSI